MDRIFLEVRNWKGDNLCFVERPRSFIDSSLLLVRGELDTEVGDLLPAECKFCRRGFPVSRKQEQDLKLNTCIQTYPLMMKTRIHAMYHVIIALKIKDNMAATNITPPRARINRPLITGAGASITQTDIDERLESIILSNAFPNLSFSDTN